MEIIVVDDASTDATPAAAATGVRVIHAPRNGDPGTARNLGAGKTLFFVDSDVVIGPGRVARKRNSCHLT